MSFGSRAPGRDGDYNTTSSDDLSPPMSLIYDQYVEPLRNVYRHEGVKSPASVTSPLKLHPPEPTALIPSPNAPSLSPSSPATSAEASPPEIVTPGYGNLDDGCALASDDGESYFQVQHNGGPSQRRRPRSNYWNLDKRVATQFLPPTLEDVRHENTQSHTQFRFPRPITELDFPFITPEPKGEHHRFFEYPPSSQEQYPRHGEMLYQAAGPRSRHLEISHEIDLQRLDTADFEREMIKQADIRNRAYREAFHYDRQLTEQKLMLQDLENICRRTPARRQGPILTRIAQQEKDIQKVENYLQPTIEMATSQQAGLEKLVAETFTGYPYRYHREITPEETAVLHESQLLPPRHASTTNKGHRDLRLAPEEKQPELALADRQFMGRPQHSATRRPKPALWKQWEQAYGLNSD